MEASRDRFGVSLRLLGDHDDDFYAAVGRFVLLTSLLEDRLRVLHDRFGCRHPSGADSLYAVIAACGQHLVDVADQQDRGELKILLAKSEQARLVRNQLAHYLFPAQQDGSVFGWSDHRGKLRTTDDSSPNPTRPSADARETLADWIRRVGELSATVEGVDRAIWRLPARAPYR
jgi:hypothetical protein